MSNYSSVSPTQLACGAAAAGAAYLLTVLYKLVKDHLKSDAQKLREKHFYLEAGTAFINHASFGTVPRCIGQLQQDLREEIDTHPDKWFHRTAPQRFQRSVEAVAEFVGAPADCVTMIENVSTGISSVLRSLKLGEDDAVMTTSLAYQAVKNAADFLGESGRCKSLRIELKFPIESENDLVTRFIAELDAHPNVRVCILDHITSSTAMVMPVKRLTELMHSRNIRVIVDGAHAPGQLPLNMVDLGVDYYAGNLYKWCYTPRGCAFLYARREFHDEIMPLVISWRWKESFTNRFEKLGARDQTALFTVPESLKFFNDVLHGQDAVVKRNSELVDRAADLCAKRWGTERLAIPRHMEAPNMRLIELPLLGIVSKPALLMEVIYVKYKVMVCTFELQGKPYCRISANVYNEFQDYERLADDVHRLTAELTSQ